jgi:hypothetical protein
LVASSNLAGRILPKWRNGRRKGFKILRGKPHVGSTPTFGTTTMLDNRKQKWLPYVRKVADLMNLKDWTIVISDHAPDNSDYEASCYIPEGRKYCTIHLSEHFLDNTPNHQRETLVHELQHCHTECLKRCVEKTVGINEWYILQVLMEYCVDDTASYVAKFLPLPEEIK